MPSERVLIVGGGVAGLALAIALRQRGILAAVVERGDPDTTAGAGLYLVGAATRGLTALGVLDAATRAGAVIRSQAFYTHRGRRLAEIDAQALWSGCGPCLGITRAALHRLLTKRAAAGLSIRYGTSIATLAQDAEAVSVECSDGSRARYELVVGADGIRSLVRRLALTGQEPHFRGQVGWRFLAPRPPGIDAWSVFLGPDSAFLLLPVSRDQVYCYADRMLREPLADPPQGRLERLRTTFQHFAEPVREAIAALEAPEQVHFAAIEDLVLDQWGRGRVLLTGDAAHAMSPNMACGVAMAVEDALILAEFLGDTTPWTAVLARFQQRRAARVRWLRAQTDRRDRLRRLPVAIRNAVLRLQAERTYHANYRPLLAPP
jgi:2-polyprenyl-6-methoxyphenol hydroxylase-like FAD-dependent oxidoreductase